MSKKIKIATGVVVVAIFVALLVVATFFDYEISSFVSVVNGSSYLAKSTFGRFFEAFGEVPLYFALGFGVAYICVWCHARENKRIEYVLVSICVAATAAAYIIMFKRCFAYLADYAGRNDDSRLKLAIWVAATLLGLLFAAATLVIAFKTPKRYVGGLFVFGLIVVAAFAISHCVVHGVKPFFGRQRYRMIKVLEYNGLNDLVDYSKWFVVNGRREVTTDLLALGIAKDGYKSFPSGHTCAAAMSLCVVLLPDALSLDGKKYRFVKIVLTAVAVSYTITVAFSRVYMGAHYLSDVLIGGSVTAVSIIISEKVVKTLVKKFKL